MIEKDILLYLQGYTALTTLIGNKMYIVQAPSTSVQMPWLIIENTAGQRNKIAQNLMEEIAYCRVSVDCGPAQAVAGRNIIEVAKTALENFRGLLNSANDAHVVCGSVRGWAGIGGAYRYQFDATIRFTEVHHQPGAYNSGALYPSMALYPSAG
jgi:hypothetical protein